MNVQQDHCSKKSNQMCIQCTLFYGSEAFGGLCSSCHKYIPPYEEKLMDPKRKNVQPKAQLRHRLPLAQQRRTSQNPWSNSLQSQPSVSKKIKKDALIATRRQACLVSNVSAVMCSATLIDFPKIISANMITS